MKKKKTSYLVWENIILLIPLIIYGIFKNGYLIYEKGYINFYQIFKPLYLVLIGIIIKFIIDLIKDHKIKIDYNLVYIILIGMIMPYNINLIIYSISLLILYIITLFLEKYLKFNKVCFIYLIIILINFIFNEFTFQNILESRFTYSFTFFDLLVGRSIGSISTTSIFFSLLSFSYLTFSYYYKKDIPLFINITYLFLSFIYLIITKDNSYLLNSEVLFASIFIAPLPKYSPLRRINQIIYGISIGILTFIGAVLFNSIISIYLVIFIISLLPNIKLKKKLSNKMSS